MTEIACRYRSVQGDQPVCQVVADLVERPLAECHVNDAACAHCLGCGVAPQAPNAVTASMSIGVAHRSGDSTFLAATVKRMQPHLPRSEPAPTACILRGPEIRQVKCKPCQANSLVPVMVPVYRCPKHSECTLHNVGVQPRIQACSTCQDRLEKAYPISTKPVPQSVLDQINQQRTGNRP